MAQNTVIGKKRSIPDLPRHGNRAGFTMIELLIIMTIIGILAAMAIPTYRNAVIKAKEAVLKRDLFVLRDVIDQYYTDKGTYPLDLVDLVDEGYIRELPVDPITGSDETWEPVYFEEEVEEILEGEETEGIWDIRSGSQEEALDGTIYNDW